jgi:K+-transporting ATPase KdpF subunit
MVPLSASRPSSPSNPGGANGRHTLSDARLGLLRDDGAVRARLRAALSGETPMFEIIMGSAVAAFLFAYLLVALLAPEKF